MGRLLFTFAIILSINLSFANAQEIYQPTEELYSMEDEILTFVSADKQDFYYTAREFNKRSSNTDSNVLFRKRQNAGGSWSVETIQIPGLNPDQPFSVIGANNDGQKIYLLNSFRGDNLSESGVYYAENNGGGWSPLYRMFVEGLYEYEPVYSGIITPDGNMMFLSLDDPRVEGAENLYLSQLTTENRWSWPVRLEGTNSLGSEFSPLLSDDGQYLYFASDRPGGLGASDIYVSDRLDNSYLSWSAPRNMGPEINTLASETFYTELDHDQYFVVQGDNRPNNRYYNTIVLEVEGREESVIAERSDDYQDDLPTVDDSEAESGFAGLFEEPAEATAVNYESNNIEEPARGIPTYNLSGSEVGERFFNRTTNGEAVFFGLDSDQLTPQGRSVLNAVANSFRDNPRQTVEVVGKACSIGNESYNLGLSYRRATTVAAYLVSLGVNSSQVVTKGLGESEAYGSSAEDRKAEINYLSTF